ncbi:MAG: hypothetical protein ABSC61_05790, partial [Anaerolineales bacterium]
MGTMTMVDRPSSIVESIPVYREAGKQGISFPISSNRFDGYIIHLSNLPAEYPAACCGDERGLFPLPREGKLKMGWGQETGKTIK